MLLWQESASPMRTACSLCAGTFHFRLQRSASSTMSKTGNRRLRRGYSGPGPQQIDAAYLRANADRAHGRKRGFDRIEQGRFAPQGHQGSWGVHPQPESASLANQIRPAISRKRSRKAAAKALRVAVAVRTGGQCSKARWARANRSWAILPADIASALFGSSPARDADHSEIRRCRDWPQRKTRDFIGWLTLFLPFSAQL